MKAAPRNIAEIQSDYFNEQEPTSNGYFNEQEA